MKTNGVCDCFKCVSVLCGHHLNVTLILSVGEWDWSLLQLIQGAGTEELGSVRERELEGVHNSSFLFVKSRQKIYMCVCV